MIRLLAAFAAVLCLFAGPAFASHIYQLPKGHGLLNAMTVLTAEFQKTDNVVDSVLELGIVVTREPLSADVQAQAGVSDFGDVSRVHLIAPRVSTLSTSPFPASMWGLKAIHLAEAWKVSKGAGVIVAVSDTGVSSTHKELGGQMWKNPGEVGADAKGTFKESNGFDDDGNGYVDDVYGWDFVKKKPSGVDHHFHGTHVAGTIAAIGSKKMAGIAPLAKIMDVSFLDSEGSGDDVDGAKSIVYAVNQGAKIINCSWGSQGSDQVVEAAMKYAHDHGVLVVAAAGNDGANNDKHLFTPSGYAFENIVSVGATSSASGSRASFSNYGLTMVDLAAPGDQIYSLAPGNSHQTLSGTSMASPHVAAVAALVWSAHPMYTWQQVKKALMAVSPASSWKKKSVSGGMLEADLAVTH